MFKAVYHKLSRELETYFSNGNFSGRLPGVLPLCRHFKTSKNTMSKALHILQKRGIIRIEGTRGMFFNGGLIIRSDTKSSVYADLFYRKNSFNCSMKNSDIPVLPWWDWIYRIQSTRNCSITGFFKCLLTASFC